MNQSPTITLLSAPWVAPMRSAPIRDGAVAIAGDRIVAVGAAEDLSQKYPAALVIHYDNAVLTPGLVNAHVHLELSDRDPGNPPASLADWLIGVMAQSPPPSADAADRVAAAARVGAAESLRCGVTSVGDITAWPEVTRQALADVTLRIVSFGEVRAMASRRGLLAGRIAQASAPAAAPNIRIGLSPHAPYSVEPEGYRQMLALAEARALPLATHLAESAEEAAFLSDHAGPLRRVWDFLQAWDDRVPRWHGGPVRLADDVGLLDYPSLLAHVNYCDDAELELLARGRASVVYCPRTHAYFGHPLHRWRDMLARGVNVALGTDSRASSPSLDLLDDLCLLRRLAPDFAVHELWQLVTLGSARALWMEDLVGSLEPGKYADIVAFPAGPDDPLAFVLDNPAAPLAVWVGGQLQVA